MGVMAEVMVEGERIERERSRKIYSIIKTIKMEK